MTRSLLKLLLAGLALLGGCRLAARSAARSYAL